jgi:hypothetical protein
MLSQIGSVRIKAIIEKLASYGTRHTMSSQTDPNREIGAARDWLLEQYRGFVEESGGYMSVVLQSYIQPVASRITAPTNISNIVATLRGTGDPERIVVVRYIEDVSGIGEKGADGWEVITVIPGPPML